MNKHGCFQRTALIRHPGFLHINIAALWFWMNQLRWSDMFPYSASPYSLTRLIKNGVFCLTWPVPVTVLTLFGGPGCCQQEQLQHRLLKRRLISTLQNNTREQSRLCLLKHIREVVSLPKALLSQTQHLLCDHREKNAPSVILIKW